MFALIGKAYRETSKLSLPDYFQAGGASLEDYKNITGIDIQDLTIAELKNVCSSLSKIGFVVDLCGRRKPDLINAVVSAIRAGR